MYASTEQCSRERVQALADALYTEHRGRLLAIARRNSACAEDAEEALQDAFILFIDHFEPRDGAPPLAWLSLTLKRRCWALYQLRRRGWGQGRAARPSTAPPRRYWPAVSLKAFRRCPGGAAHPFSPLSPRPSRLLAVWPSSASIESTPRPRWIRSSEVRVGSLSPRSRRPQ